MKNYSFSNLTVRPFPTIADLNNPWIFGGVQALSVVSAGIPKPASYVVLAAINALRRTV